MRMTCGKLCSKVENARHIQVVNFPGQGPFTLEQQVEVPLFDLLI